MARDLSRSRSPSYRRVRISRRSRRDRSRSPYSSYIHSRHKSRSISPRRHRSRSRTPKRHRSRSPTPKHHRRGRSCSTSSSPVQKSASPSLGSVVHRNASEKLKQDEEERQRRQHEAELKLIEEETTRRVEEAIQRQVAGNLDTEDIRLELQRYLEEGKKKLQEVVKVQLEKEKEAAVIEGRRKEEQALKEKEELERKLEENRRKLEQTQRLEALEQEKKEQQRYIQLEEMQKQKEEAMKRQKQEEAAERAKQMVVLGKNKSRPKLSFAFNSK